MTTNTIKTTANLLKAGLIGFVAAAGFGLLTLPAKADEVNPGNEVNQGSVQTSQQEGFDNTNIIQNDQKAVIRENQTRIGHPAREGRTPNKINQNTDQLGSQYGGANTNVIQNHQNGRIQSDRTSIGR